MINLKPEEISSIIKEQISKYQDKNEIKEEVKQEVKPIEFKTVVKPVEIKEEIKRRKGELFSSFAIAKKIKELIDKNDKIVI